MSFAVFLWIVVLEVRFPESIGSGTAVAFGSERSLGGEKHAGLRARECQGTTATRITPFTLVRNISPEIDSVVDFRIIRDTSFVVLSFDCLFRGMRRHNTGERRANSEKASLGGTMNVRILVQRKGSIKSRRLQLCTCRIGRKEGVNGFRSVVARKPLIDDSTGLTVAAGVSMSRD
jgi:hypothetical protein